MHLGGKCKISWSNESIRSQGAMADRVKTKICYVIHYHLKKKKGTKVSLNTESLI